MQNTHYGDLQIPLQLRMTVPTRDDMQSVIVPQEAKSANKLANPGVAPNAARAEAPNAR